jgi:hypothetical protein
VSASIFENIMFDSSQAANVRLIRHYSYTLSSFPNGSIGNPGGVPAKAGIRVFTQ